MNQKDRIEHVVIFNGSGWETAMIKSLLENAEIEAFLEDEISGIMMPWQTAAGGIGPVKVAVSSVDLDRAIQVVDEYNRNRRD